MSQTRDYIAGLISEMLAIQTAQRLGYGITLPDDSSMMELIRNTKDTADKLIGEFEKEALILEVKSTIINDLRRELLKRTTTARIIDIGITVSSFVAVILIGASQFIFVPDMNRSAISASYWIILGVIVLQFVGNLYLQHLDRNGN